MSTFTINGARVVAGSLTIPTYGAWAADVTLAVADELASAATIVVGDLTLIGTVIRQASFAGSRTARVVGGAGGWRSEIPSRGYAHLAGVKLSLVLNDAARESGESIVVSPDKVIGTHYVRERAKAERVLHLLLDGQWWIDPAGVTRMTARSAASISTPFTVIKWDGGKGQFEIATEAISQWQPGRTFTAATVPGVQIVSSVTIDVDNAGKLRLHVLSADATIERLRSDLRALIRSEIASLSYSGVWEYTIASGDSSALDLVSTDPRMPTIGKCPMMPGLMGEVVTPTPGSKCRVVFVNGSPMRPECIGIVGSQVLAKIAGGAQGAARTGDSISISAAQILAAGLSSPSGPVTGGPVSGTITGGSSKVQIG